MNQKTNVGICVRLFHKFRPLYKILILLRKMGRKLCNVSADISYSISCALNTDEDVFFIQVGSNDGRFGDPLRDLIKSRNNWRGIFIEPVPYAMAALKENYGDDDRFVFENIAISEKAERRRFYYVSEAAKYELGDILPPWFDQLGSFNKEHIGNHLDGLLVPYIVETELECLPLIDVIRRNAVISLDLIHIDTEGYDFEILKQLDLRTFRPKVILYEHKHLAIQDAMAAEYMLLNAGYQIKTFSSDTLAIKTRHQAL